ncbi:MAG: glutamate--tRNA ligase [Planctomycetales bacterium]|nr:glutamate--tRNA ligase [Planctomycetales bacterium]
MTVRTRFAPSPTGYLHIGGVRTALFNWLFSRKHGGQFLLRIDDTDQERNVEAALAPILHGFRWLGLDWDEGPEVGGPHGPYYQSQRLHRYQDAAKKLVAAGLAYRDYATADEVKQEREAAEAEKRPFVYSRRWMAETDTQAASFEAQGRQGVVRLKMPREGKLVIPDLVRGDVEFQWASEQDHVIQRADGTCLYHLASVVDDFDFEISHVIRAEEHLSNTPRQIFIAQSLGYPLPQYAHLPYVAEPGSKNKLSKRKIAQYLKNAEFKKLYDHGQGIAAALGLTTSAETFNPVIVDFYEQVGYLPEAILNYLVLLGWSLDDKTEYFTVPEMIENFSLERVGKSPASFDPKKLWAFEDRYMQELPTKKKVPQLIPYLQKAGYLSKPVDCEMGPKLAQIAEAAGNRIKTFGDVLNYTNFLTADEKLTYDEGAFTKAVKAPGAVELLAKYAAQLATVEPYDVARLEAFSQEFITAEGKKIGELVHPLRVALTGQGVGLGLFDTLAILGRESSLRRIELAIAKAGN